MNIYFKKIRRNDAPAGHTTKTCFYQVIVQSPFHGSVVLVDDIGSKDQASTIAKACREASGMTLDALANQ